MSREKYSDRIRLASAAHVLLIHVLFLFSTGCFSQNVPADSTQSPYRLLDNIPVTAKSFTTDKLQNIYYVDVSNEVIKLDANGVVQFRYINKTLGEPAYIDATNPFNLLLFYPDYQNVITLDRTMNLAGQFNLYSLGFYAVNAVGAAGDGNLWLYDELSFKLIKIGEEGKILLKSADLSLELGKTIRPNFILERNQQVFLNDPAIGILVFDVFGRYLKTLPLTGLNRFQIVGDKLYYRQEGELNYFHLQALLPGKVLLPQEVSAEGQLSIENDRLYILQDQLIKVYAF